MKTTTQLFACFFLCLRSRFVCLSVCLSACLSVNLSFDLSLCPSCCLLSVYLPVSMYVGMPLALSIQYLSTIKNFFLRFRLVYKAGPLFFAHRLGFSLHHSNVGGTDADDIYVKGRSSQISWESHHTYLSCAPSAVEKLWQKLSHSPPPPPG